MSSTITTPWKIEKHLCRCCHAEGTFTNMGIPCYDHLGQQEIYADMLRECLNVYIMPVSGDLNQPTYTICTDCINQLKNANKFKKQVLLCEKKFSEMYTKNVISVGDSLAHEPIVKIEFEGVKSEFKLDFSDEEDAEVLEMAPDSDEDYFLDDPPAPDASDEESKSLSLLKDSSTKRTSTRVKNAPKKPKLEQKLNTSGRPKKAPAKKAKAKKADNSGDAEGAGPAPKNLKPTPREPEDFTSIEGGFACTKCNNTFKLKAHMKEHVLQIHYKYKRIQIQRKCGCPVCPAKFRTVPEMDQHQIEKHGSIKRYTCKYCPTEFKRLKTLKMHIKSFHKLGQLYKCDLCEYETYGDPQNLRRHKLRHVNAHIVCLYCGKAFVDPRNLATHEKIHTRKNLKYCDHCNSSYVTLKGLRAHIVKHHLNAVTANDLERDGTKVRRVRRKKEIAEHKENQNELYKTTIQQKKNDNSQETGSPEPQKRIDIMQPLLYILNKGNEKQGVQLVKPRNFFKIKDDDYQLVGDIYKCTQCQKEFKSYKRVLQHIKCVHYKYKYKHTHTICCTQCPQRFRTSGLLQEHQIQEHGEIKKITCTACTAEFNNINNLKKHMNNFHMLGTPKKCSQCDYIAFSTARLKRHKEKHVVEKSHVCKFCGKGFVRRANWLLHERIHTREKLKQCSYCDQGFVQRTSLKYHILKYHPGKPA